MPAHNTPGPVEPAGADLIPRALDASHRCDSCGAQAYASTTVSGVELLFCGHHFTRHESALRTAATIVIDERHAIATSERLRALTGVSA